MEAEKTAGRVFRMRTNCELLNNAPVEALGEGLNRRDAERAAYTHLLAKLHSGGQLKQFFEAGSVDKKTMAEEKDAKIDIYNYAARYGQLAQFSHTTSRLKSKKGGKGAHITEATIELPEQDIKVSGMGRTVEAAEVAAALNFKNEAEKYQAKQGTDSLVIRDSSALGVANARSFFDFCRANRFDYRASVEVSQENNSVYAQAILNDEPVGEPVFTSKKKQAEDVAYLVAALEVAKQEPALLSKFQRALKQSGGRILPPAPLVDCSLDPNLMDLMDNTVRRARAAGLHDTYGELEANEEVEERRQLRRPTLGPSQRDVRSQQLREELERYDSNPELAKLRQTKADLPMNQHAKEVLTMVDENTYSIVIGATGSGKTTQVPQIILDNAIRTGEGGSCNVICTQPRRIAATSVGRRVADERAQKLQGSVGYHVRHDPKPPRPGGSITYCTTGILLQQLQHSPDEIMDSVSHLIIDEVHERDILIDFLLIIVKKVMAQRAAAGKSCPRVVLMSATMDSELFSSYFSSSPAADNPTIDCPTLRVPGRLFPVTETYLDSIVDDLQREHGDHQLSAMRRDIDSREYLEFERQFAQKQPKHDNGDDAETAVEEENVIDWKRERIVTGDGEISATTENEDAKIPIGLVATTVAHIAKTTDEGAILVFLPGLEEILSVQEVLTTQKIFGVDVKDEANYKTFLLHSSVQDSQREVFNPVPPSCRKIILATNIAETSVTIPDVQYVVDTGKLREKRYDQLTRITKLQCTWVSKSNAKQRAGRAGRVQNGHYFGLFTKARKESLRAVGLPEILRSDLQKVCLDVKAQRFKAPVREFLADAIEPPSSVAVDKSVNSLIDLDCLTEDEKLTALGRLLASLPVHPSLGKMIVLGVLFRCLDPMLIISAAAEDRDLFVNPPESRAAAVEAKKSFLRGSESDHVAFLNAFRELRHVDQARGKFAQRDFAMNNFLHPGAYRNITNAAQQIEQVFVEAGLIPHTAPEQRVDWQFGDPALNTNSNHVDLVKALILSGHHPNIAVRTNLMLLRAPNEPNTLFHPGSVNALSSRELKNMTPEDIATIQPRGQLYTYSVMAKSNDGRSIFLRNASRVTPLMLALFSGRLNQSETDRRTLEADDWLPLRVEPGWVSAKAILNFRRALERMQTDAFSDLSSGKPLAEHPVREIFAKALVEILYEAARPIGRATDFSRTDSWRSDRNDRRSDRSDWRSNRRGRDSGLDMAFGGVDSYRPARQQMRSAM